MRVDRLLKLADFLETAPRKAFDMRNWQVKRATKPEGKKPGECGFAGCAMGWAAHTRMFRGLRIDTDGDLVFKKPMFDGHGFEAAAAPFEISTADARHLFDPEHYYDFAKCIATPATPKNVAKRIRAFVKSKQDGAT